MSIYLIDLSNQPTPRYNVWIIQFSCSSLELWLRAFDVQFGLGQIEIETKLLPDVHTCKLFEQLCVFGVPSEVLQFIMRCVYIWYSTMISPVSSL